MREIKDNTHTFQSQTPIKLLGTLVTKEAGIATVTKSRPKSAVCVCVLSSAQVAEVEEGKTKSNKVQAQCAVSW